MDLILIAKESMPLYFESKNKDLDDLNVTAFISAVKSFARGSLQSDLISLKLGDLDIRLSESEGLLYVLGMSVNTEIMPSEHHINNLLKELSSLATVWVSENTSSVIDASSVPKQSFTEVITKFEQKVLDESEKEKINNGNKIVATTIKDWNLLPLKTQELLMQLLEPLILGEKIAIVDNNPNVPLIKDLCNLFRLPKNITSKFDAYTTNIILSADLSSGLIINAETNKVTGKFEKNKYLIKYLEKILNQTNVEHQNRLVTLLTSTLGTITTTIINFESDYANQQGKILNLLNNMAFEEVRLVLELLKRNKPTLHEKIVKLPIHKEWFNSWQSK